MHKCHINHAWNCEPEINSGVSDEDIAILIKEEVAALKRERTIEAAALLFYEHGYEKTTIDAIALHMGVTKPFIYAHFKSKAQLLAEICKRGVATSLVAITEALALDATPTEQLRYLGQQFIVTVLENQRNIAVLTREEKHLDAADYQRLSGLRREFDRKLVELLKRGTEDGSFHLRDTNVAALAIGGLVSWAYVWYRPHGRLSIEELAETMTELILAMAGVKTDTPT